MPQRMYALLLSTFVLGAAPLGALGAFGSCTPAAFWPVPGISGVVSLDGLVATAPGVAVCILGCLAMGGAGASGASGLAAWPGSWMRFLAFGAWSALASWERTAV